MQDRKLRTMLILLAASACFSSAQIQSGSATVMEGIITVSPSRPGPTRENIPNSAPVAKATFTVATQSGVVTTFTTDDEGRFRVSLQPGRYTVSLQNRKSGIGRFGPWDVEV